MKTIARNPRVGDVVVSKSSGLLWLVDDRTLRFLAVDSVAHPGRPNTFYRNEVSVLAAADAAAARQTYRDNGGHL